MNEVLARWNALERSEAAAEILPCNGARAWADRMASMRPCPEAAALCAASDAVWASLTVAAWQEAFDSHPRLGEAHAKEATRASLDWSATEQAGLSADEVIRQELRKANAVYEQRFGRIFLLCASGKSAQAVLASLQARLGHTPEMELREAAEQQRRITQLRLRKWLGLPAAACEDV